MDLDLNIQHRLRVRRNFNRGLPNGINRRIPPGGLTLTFYGEYLVWGENEWKTRVFASPRSECGVSSAKRSLKDNRRKKITRTYPLLLIRVVPVVDVTRRTAKDRWTFWCSHESTPKGYPFANSEAKTVLSLSHKRRFTPFSPHPNSR